MIPAIAFSRGRTKRVSWDNEPIIPTPPPPRERLSRAVRRSPVSRFFLRPDLVHFPELLFFRVLVRIQKRQLSLTVKSSEGMADRNEKRDAEGEQDSER